MILFENKKLRGEIEILKKQIAEGQERTARVLKQIFLLNHKPKFKVGQKVWIPVCSGFGHNYEYVEAIVGFGRAEQTYFGDIAYFYKCMDLLGQEHKINELSINTTKPKSCI